MGNDVLYNFGRLIYGWFAANGEYAFPTWTETRLIGLQAIIDLIILCAILLVFIGIGIHLIVRDK